MPDWFICNECGEAFPIHNCHQVDLSPGCDNPETTGDLCYWCADAMRYWRAQQRDFDPAHAVVGTDRAFGVEIETSKCPRYIRIRNKSCFGAKPDSSISGIEFVSPILRGDEGLKEVQTFLHYANQYGFMVDDRCGLHVHINVQNLSPLQQRKIAYAFVKTTEVWHSFINKSRDNCLYARRLDYNCADIQNCRYFHNFAASKDRYGWLNIAAVDCHNTFEVRLHQGSLDRDEVCNWIIALLRFVDAVKDIKYRVLDELFKGDPVLQFEQIKQLWQSDQLSRYYDTRTRLNTCVSA